MSSPIQQAAVCSSAPCVESVQSQVRSHLASRGKVGGPFILFAVLAHGLGTGFAQSYPLVFGLSVGTLVVTIVLRLLLLRRFDSWSKKSSNRWYTGFQVTSFLLSASLGIYMALNLILEGHSPESMLALLVGCAIAAGAMAVLHADTVCYRTFVLFTLVPAALACSQSSDPVARTTGFLILLYLGFLLVAGTIFRRQYLDLIESRQLLAERGAELERARYAADMASRAKSEFLANMSHEIRTPLSGVLGMTRMALDSTVKEERDEFLDLSLKSGDMLLSIINDILDLSKIEAGKLTLRSGPFDLRELVGATLQMLAHRTRGLPLSLVWAVDDDVPEQLTGDSSRLRQILLNLVGNAVKFTPRGEVAVHFQRGQGAAAGITLLGEVRDTGSGIPLAYQNVIFGAFEQAGHEPIPNAVGTGLGLTICRRLVELMDGEIEVESEEGRGSTFRFQIRLQVDEQRRREPSAHSLCPLKARIALCQSHPVANSTLARLIQETGARCDIFGQLDEVGHAARSGEYDLALVELPTRREDHANFLDRVVKVTNDVGLPILFLQLPGESLSSDSFQLHPSFVGRILVPVVPSQVRKTLSRVLTPSPATATRRKGQGQSGSSSSLHVLVAEDNRVNQILVRTILQKLGHSIEMVEDGRAAVEAYDRTTFDLILMDIQMPRLNGIEATREIRQREEISGRRTPIVALTADVVESTESKCREAGMDDYLLKPFRYEDFSATIEQFTPRVADRS